MMTTTTQHARIAFFLVVLVAICDDASPAFIVPAVVAGRMRARPVPNMKFANNESPIGGVGADKKKSALPPAMIFQAKKTKWNDDEEEKEGTSGPFQAFKKSPGTIIIAPLVLLFGLDLLANIAVLTKRSIEVALTGEYTVWNPFQ